jgi:hypothetical protein
MCHPPRAEKSAIPAQAGRIPALAFADRTNRFHKIPSRIDIPKRPGDKFDTRDMMSGNPKNAVGRK